MSADIEARLSAVFASARGKAGASREVFQRLQFFAKAMRHAPSTAGASALVWFDEREEIRGASLGTHPVTIGRDATCDVVLVGARVSRQHCRLRRAIGGGGIEIEDLGSSNGTLVNGIQLTPGKVQFLHDGDVIEIGGAALAVAGN